MNCIRCARETEENHIFCNKCLEQMESQPVDPGTPIQLPHRPERVITKRSSFKLAASKWENQLFRLRYTIFWLVMAIILLLGALVFCVCLLLELTPQWVNEWLDLPTIREAIQAYFQ